MKERKKTKTEFFSLWGSDSGPRTSRRAACAAVSLALIATGALTLSAAAPAATTTLCPPGAGAGQCSSPEGLAVDRSTGETSSGRLYVADEGNDRIVAFDSSESFEFDFGAGTLDSPSSVAVDNDETSAFHRYVYVADFGNRRIVRFNPKGEEPFFFGEGDFVGSEEMLVAAGPSGEIIVADSSPTAKIRLREYEPTGGAPAREKVEVVGQQKDPRGLAIDSAAAVYIRDDVGGGENSLCRYEAVEWEEGFCFGGADSEGVRAIATDGADHLFTGGLDRDAGGSAYRVIAEYDPAGEALRRFGYGMLLLPGFVNGLALAPGSVGPAYASIGDEVLSVPFPPQGPIAVDPTVQQASSANATVTAEVNPEGTETEYTFQYLTEEAFEEDGEAFEGPNTLETDPMTLPAGTRLTPAEGIVGCPDPVTEAGEEGNSCLQREATYVWRIVAANEDGAGEGTVRGPDFEAPDSPLIEEAWVTEAGTDAATLNLRANPLGVAATTRFEYVTEAQFQASGFDEGTALPAEDFDLGEGFDPISRSITAFPLKAATDYRYRVVATNVLRDPEDPVIGGEGAFSTLAPSRPIPCASEGAREGLPGARTGPAAFLPDCRAYEMVSPPDKNSADIVYVLTSAGKLPATLEKSAASGSRMTFTALVPFADPAGAPIVSHFIADRVPSPDGEWDEEEGWQTHSINSPRKRLLTKALVQFDTEFEAFSEDLCQGWTRTVADPTLAPGAIAGHLNLYRRSDEACGGPGHLPLTTTPAPPNLSPTFYGLELQGVSADGRRAIYRGNDTLEGTDPEAPPQSPECKDEFTSKCKQRLYLHEARTGATRFLCVLPGGVKAESCAAGTSVGGNAAQRMRESSLEDALSADGRRIFWTTPAPGEGKIHMREVPEEPGEVSTHTGLGKVSKDSTALTSLFAAVGKAAFTEGSTEAELLETTTGEFLAGQPLTSSKLPAGTTLVSIEGTTLNLSQPATGDSAGVGILSPGPEPFAPGQQISGEGIPPGTTIEAAAAGELTLSKAATLTKGGVALTATDECSAPELPCTTPVSAGGEALSESSGSRWWCAAKSGSVAIYSTGSELYEFHPAGEVTHEVVGGFLGLAGCSADGSVIYLASEEALAGEGVTEENSEGDEAVPGEPNLYRYEAAPTPGDAGAYEFVGTLVESDVTEPGGFVGPVAEEPTARFSRLTPDGGALAFMSAAELTGQDSADANHGAPDMQVFLHDGATGELSCASCNPTGARPVGANANRNFDGDPAWAAGRIPQWQNPLYAARALSDDGRRVFFESHDKLVARDVNGRQDVYQWEAPGKGTCTAASASYSPRNEGCIDLVSSGQGGQDVDFRDASPSGEDVFFATAKSLLPQDHGLIDIYDARVGGGLPVPPEPEAPCEGDACQDPASEPGFDPPSSSSFQGPGNIGPPAPSPCARQARRAKRASNRARSARRSARRAARKGNRRSARRSARRAKRSARQARRLSRGAKRCRRARAAGRAAR